MDFDKKTQCNLVEVDGFIEAGKQFDIDINLPEDNRDVIYGIIKDSCDEPVKDAVVKLIEVVCEKGEEIRKPVSHTFTDKYGEFVFGPLCPDRKYAIDIWVNRVKHVKLASKCHHQGKCLKGKDIDHCECYVENRDSEYRSDCCDCAECQEQDCSNESMNS